MTDELKFNVKEYLNQYHIIDDNGMNYRRELSQKLYKAILNKFKINMTQEEYYPFKEFQERIFNLIENLRELETNIIPLIFDYLQKINVYLIDIIIMLWCLPRSDDYLSKKMYDKKYTELIKNYHHKMIHNIKHKCMENFCIESITKTNNVPVHCIDYIWFYMSNLSLDFTFYNSNGGNYICFMMPEHNHCDEFINFGFNMEHLLNLGLGQISHSNDPHNKGSFRNFLFMIITNLDVVKKLIQTQNNFKKQFLNISKDVTKYFGKDAILSDEIINEISK